MTGYKNQMTDLQFQQLMVMNNSFLFFDTDSLVAAILQRDHGNRL